MEVAMKQSEQSLAQAMNSARYAFIRFALARLLVSMAAGKRVADLDRLLAENARLREALEAALDCKGSYNGTVSQLGGYPALCTKCEEVAHAALAPARADSAAERAGQ
jgi:hypothetical protein